MMSSQIEPQLSGVWVPSVNWTIPDRDWPRLIFLNGRGYFEDGDCPAIYSVEHFKYEIKSPTVLEVTESAQEFLDETERGNEFDESWVETRLYDMCFHRRNERLFLKIEICRGPTRMAQFCKSLEQIASDYKPNWNFA